MFEGKLEAWAKKQVTTVWEELKDDVTTRLSLDVTPSLYFISDPQCEYGLMWVRYTCDMDGVGERVLRTVPDYTIYVNLPGVIEKIANTVQVTANCASIDHIVRFLLMHECRHIWQAQTSYSKDILNTRSYYERNFPIAMSHGKRKEEEDANSFALSLARDKREKALFLLEKHLQENALEDFPLAYYNLVKGV